MTFVPGCGRFVLHCGFNYLRALQRREYVRLVEGRRSTDPDGTRRVSFIKVRRRR